MAETQQVASGDGFELTSLPEPMAVKDPDTGAIVPGYQVTVRSTTTGAKATLDIPKQRFSPDYLAAQARAALEPLDAAVAKYGAAGMTGASSSG